MLQAQRASGLGTRARACAPCALSACSGLRARWQPFSSSVASVSSGTYLSVASVSSLQPLPRRQQSTVVRANSGAGALPAAAPPPDAAQQRATFLRLVLPTCLALLLCNMDRICLSVAILPMSAEFGWPPGEQPRGPAATAFLAPLRIRNWRLQFRLALNDD